MICCPHYYTLILSCKPYTKHNTTRRAFFPRDFLQGTRIALGTRARGYHSDADVWRAVASHPDLAVIDSQAVLSRNGYAAQPLPGVPANLPQFVMDGVHQEDTTPASRVYR